VGEEEGLAIMTESSYYDRIGGGGGGDGLPRPAACRAGETRRVRGSRRPAKNGMFEPFLH